MTKLSLYLATLLLGSNFSASTVPADPPALVQSAQMTVEEQRFVDLANSERWDKDMRMLAVNPLLTQIARRHSREMAERSYFDHISPTPELRTPMDRYLSSFGRTPTWALVGENLFYCSTVDSDLGHKCLMDSKPHRDNILNPRFEQVGVGAYIGPDGRFWVTEMFLAQID